MPTKDYGRMPERDFAEREKQFESQYLGHDERAKNSFRIALLPIVAKMVEIHNEQVSKETDKLKIINRGNYLEGFETGFTIVANRNMSSNASSLFNSLKDSLLKYNEKKYSAKVRTSFDGLTIHDVIEFYKCQKELYTMIELMNNKCPMPTTKEMLDTLEEVINLGAEIIHVYHSLGFDE